MIQKCSFTLLAILGFTIFTLHSHAQNERAERKYITPSVDPMDSVKPAVYPPSWWSGMETDTIELMFHGLGLKNTKLQFEENGIQILEQDTVENNNYLFVTVKIEEDASIASYPFTFVSKEEETTIEFELLGKKKHRPSPLTARDVLYLIMPDRFANGNRRNDRVTSLNETRLDRDDILARHGGDIQGILEHLDYLSELGVSALWLNPVQENNQFYESYHGYAISDHYQIDPRLGDNQLYRQLIDSCHERDIKMIMDVVLNHCGDQHFFIRDLPEKDWVHAFNTFQRSNFRATTQMDPYAVKSDKNQFVKGWFDQHMPDLNQKNPHVSRFLVQNAIWWVEFAGIDGYRIDTYPYSHIDFTNYWIETLLKEYPQLTLFGETWVHNIPIQAYFSEKNSLFEEGSNAPSLTDFQMHFALIDALMQEAGWKEGVSKIYYVLAQDFMYEQAENHIIFLDNHDLNRFWTVIEEDMDKFKMGITLLMTTRGIPMLYYGTELLFEGRGGAFGEHGRIDFPGGWSDDASSKFTEKGRTALEEEAFQFVRKLVRLRTSSPLSSGKLIQYIPDNGLYVFFRLGEETSFMIAVNRSKQKRQLHCSKYKEVLKSKVVGFDHITEQQLDLNKLEIEPNQTFLIQY